MRLLLLLAACAHTVDRDNACRMARLERNNIMRLSPGELSYLSRGTPAESNASSARAQIISAQVFGALGGASLTAAFIQGFAVDPGANPDVRTSAYVLGGSAIGFIAAALILGLTSRGVSERARTQLRDFADHCRESF